MVLSANAALKFREDYLEVVHGVVLPSMFKGDYVISGIVIVPHEVSVQHLISPEEVASMETDGFVYNPRYKKFVVLCVQHYLSESGAARAKRMFLEGTGPQLVGLNDVLRELKVGFDVEGYLWLL